SLGVSDTRALIISSSAIRANMLSVRSAPARSRISPWKRSRSRAVHVPYASSPQAVTALLRNDVQMVYLPAISIMPQLHSGGIKVLAVSTAERSPLLPDIPTLKESGIDVEADA